MRIRGWAYTMDHESRTSRLAMGIIPFASLLAAISLLQRLPFFLFFL